MHLCIPVAICKYGYNHDCSCYQYCYDICFTGTIIIVILIRLLIVVFDILYSFKARFYCDLKFQTSVGIPAVPQHLFVLIWEITSLPQCLAESQGT